MAYPNLMGEMAKRGIRQNDIAQAIGKTLSTTNLKLNGKATITVDEAVKIKSLLKSNLSLDELFSGEINGEE